MTTTESESEWYAERRAAPCLNPRLRPVRFELTPAVIAALASGGWADEPDEDAVLFDPTLCRAARGMLQRASTLFRHGVYVRLWGGVKPDPDADRRRTRPWNHWQYFCCTSPARVLWLLARSPSCMAALQASTGDCPVYVYLEQFDDGLYPIFSTYDVIRGGG